MREAVRRWDEEMATDGPLWADVVGVVCVVGLFVRGGIHAWTALLTPWTSPELADHDVTWQSPVADLRGRRVDAIARLGSLCAAGVGLSLFSPWWLASFSPPLAALAVVNIAVLAADPVAFVGARLAGANPWRADDPGLRDSIERCKRQIADHTS